MTHRSWRLIETFGVRSIDAMGLDEALLRSVGAPPTLRLYSFEPEAISLGYFQPFEDVPSAAGHPDVVRRLTGGGAIHHHGGELTFSIAIDADDPAYKGSVPDSYERTHEAVMGAIRALGVADVRMRREETCASDEEGTGMCFHASTAQDIGWTMDPATGLFAKGVGTAQRRLKPRDGQPGRILHHGSIKLSGSPLETSVANVQDAGGDGSMGHAAAELKAAIAVEFDVDLVLRDPEPDEVAAMGVLAPRYGSANFVRRAVRRRG